MRNIFLFIGFMICLFSCSNDSTQKTVEKVERPDPLAGLTISKALFGESPDGPADLYTVANKNGMEVKITNYGGIIVALKVPDKNGTIEDVALGFDNLEGYLKGHPYFGATIGRYGNRIAKGKFKLDGQSYSLATNNGPNHLHGGKKGFDKVLWEAKEVVGGDAKGVELFYRSKDMEEGYPGNLNVKVIMMLNNQNELMIRYEANTDKPTYCNLTNHTYFNLAGEGKGDILNHQVKINADWITPVDKNLIPTGAMMPVKGTPFDFRIPKAIGQDINADHQQIKYGKGYDHNFALGDAEGKRRSIATVYEPTTGRHLEVLSEEPGVQFYTGNFLDGSITGRKGQIVAHRTGFCLETQHYPDSPNHEKFPSTLLRSNEMYKTSTVFKFSVK